MNTEIGAPTAHPLHQPLAAHERFHRALWIFGAIWLFLWLLLFWFEPVGVFRQNLGPTEDRPDFVRIMSWERPRIHVRPQTPKPWERFLLEQGFPVLALYLILSIPAWLAAVLARSRSWWAGGIIGLIAGYIGGWALVDVRVGIGGAIVVGIIGAGFDYLVSTHYKIRLMRGHMPAWWAGGRWAGRGKTRWRWGQHEELRMRN